MAVPTGPARVPTLATTASLLLPKGTPGSLFGGEVVGVVTLVAAGPAALLSGGRMAPPGVPLRDPPLVDAFPGATSGLDAPSRCSFFGSGPAWPVDGCRLVEG